MAAFAPHPRPDRAENDNDPLRDNDPLGPLAAARPPLRPSAWSRANLSPAITAAIALSACQSLRNSPGETSKSRET
jgi:hypothetical protein